MGVDSVTRSEMHQMIAKSFSVNSDKSIYFFPVWLPDNFHLTAIDEYVLPPGHLKPTVLLYCYLFLPPIERTATFALLGLIHRVSAIRTKWQK